MEHIGCCVYFGRVCFDEVGVDSCVAFWRQGWTFASLNIRFVLNRTIPKLPLYFPCHHTLANDMKMVPLVQ